MSHSVSQTFYVGKNSVTTFELRLNFPKEYPVPDGQTFQNILIWSGALYFTILHSTVMYGVVRHYTVVQYSSVLYSNYLWYDILYSTMNLYIVMYFKSL